jgi:hypothetical protein
MALSADFERSLRLPQLGVKRAPHFGSRGYALGRLLLSFFLQTLSELDPHRGHLQE